MAGLNWSCQQVFPKASLIHDRCHLIQYLNKSIRRREVKEHPELKGSRYALLKNEKNRTKKQEKIFQVVKESNLNVSVSWRLREDFKAIFECTSFKEAKSYLNLWLDEVQEAGIKEVMKMESETHYGTDSPMQKQKGLTEKFKKSKPLEEDTEDLKTSALLFSSSAED